MSVKIHKILHIQLHQGYIFPVGPWLGQGQNAKVRRFSMLLNFASYMKSQYIRK